MIITQAIKKTQAQINQWKKNGHSIGLVPTMGFLHEGHISLIEKSVAENDKTVVSIFVNPTQFGPKEDFAAYPKDFEADSAMCLKAGADMLFCPEAEEMYPSGFCTYVDMEGDLIKNLCGRSRPSHFRGVCTVVAKLFNIAPAHRAYFGQKDAQQLAVITKMARDLNFDTKIIPCPTVREPDGLAKSSRNSYLSPQERLAARVVSTAIFEGERLLKAAENAKEATLGVTPPSEANNLVGGVISAMEEIIKSEPLAKIDYVELVDLYTLEAVKEIRGPILCAVAVFIGKTRLIDNFIYHP